VTLPSVGVHPAGRNGEDDTLGQVTSGEHTSVSHHGHSSRVGADGRFEGTESKRVIRIEYLRHTDAGAVRVTDYFHHTMSCSYRNTLWILPPVRGIGGGTR